MAETKDLGMVAREFIDAAIKVDMLKFERIDAMSMAYSQCVGMLVGSVRAGSSIESTIEYIETQTAELLKRLEQNL